MSRTLTLRLSLALALHAAAAAAAPTPAPATPAKAAPTTTTAAPVRPGDAPAPAPAAGAGPAAAPAPAAAPPTAPDDRGTTGLTGQSTPEAPERPWAVGVTEADREQALALFRDGNLQLNDGIFVEAAAKYREALRHWDHPAINYNLALALMNLDQPVEVYEALQKATRFGAAPLENDKFERAKGYLLLAEKQVATIQVSCDKPGAKVSVDGKEAFVGPGTFTARVRTGKHSFVAEKQGYNARVTAPYIGGGESFRIDLKLFTAEELTRYRRAWTRTWAPWAVAGGGAAIAAVGGLLALSASHGYRDFDAEVARCGAAGCEITPALSDLRGAADTKQTLAYVGYGVGGAAVVTGLVLAYLNRPRPYQIRPEDAAAEADRAPGVTLAPVLTPSMAGAAAQLRF